MDRPPREALEKAAHFLCRIGALDTKDVRASHTNTCFTRRYLNTRSSAHRPQELTDLGRKLAMMPLHPLCPER